MFYCHGLRLSVTNVETYFCANSFRLGPYNILDLVVE